MQVCITSYQADTVPVIASSTNLPHNTRPRQLVQTDITSKFGPPMIQQSSASFTIYTSVLTGIFLVSLPPHTERGGWVPLTVNSKHSTMNSLIKIFLALFFCLAVVSALPKGMGYMEIYKCVYFFQFFFAKKNKVIMLLLLFRECKARYGTKPQIECR